MEELKAHGLDSKIGAIGHRIVSGGELYSESILVDDEVIAGIEKCIPLAPLHNPAHLLGLRAAQSIFKGLPNVVVFDTAFHQSMPKTRLHLRHSAGTLPQIRPAPLRRARHQLPFRRR